MSWIKFETSTSDKPEVWQIAQILDIDPDAVVGKLLKVWTWFDQHTQDGNAPSVTKALLDRYVSVTGFCAAMIQANWMIDDESKISLPNFTRHNGDTAKKRVLTAKRVAEHKKSNAKVTQELPKSNAPSVTSALPREEKNREEVLNTPFNPPGEKQVEEPVEKKIKFNPLKVELPQELSTEAFKEAWSTWVEYRREIKKPITEKGAVAQLKKFSSWGATKSIEAIETAIASGYQGVFEPKGGATKAEPKSEIPYHLTEEYKQKRLELADKLREERLAKESIQ